MGLDQYLKCNSRTICEEAMEGDAFKDLYVPRGVAIYWRKANAVHNWFVLNVQGGDDDCGTYDVSLTDLCVLHDTCKEVLESTELVDGKLEDPSVAKELLPTCKGFFYGSTDYDTWYWEDLRYTVEAIEKVTEKLRPAGFQGLYSEREDEPGWYVKFQYESSW